MDLRVDIGGDLPGAENMRRDGAMAEALLAGTDGPAVRLYGWRPWAVSLGWHQPEGDIDGTAAAERGWDVVRRPTGGRAVLHARELTYSVVLEADGRTLADLYGRISAALLRGLSVLGVRAELASSQPDLSAAYREPLSAVCFISTVRSEVKVGGRKLIGSAQRRYQGTGGRDVVLQHGSILLGGGHERIVELMPRLAPERRDAARAEIAARTTTLADVCGRPVSWDEAASAMARGFEETAHLLLPFRSASDAGRELQSTTAMAKAEATP